MKRVLVIVVISIVAIGIVLFVLAKIIMSGEAFGDKMDAESLDRAMDSPQFVEGKFQNDPEALDNDLWVNFKDMRGGQNRVPPGPFPMDRPQISEVVGDELKATWFGHATVYVEMDGKRIITDPMLSSHAFPIRFLAPERFNPPPMTVDELPPVDIVTISHDHFDHLDMPTVKALADGGSQFFVGLGIKAHLMRWKVPETQISEMDWWESLEFEGFRIHCTPARHYSGRTGMNNSTLWTSWVIEGPNHKIFHSGDSGYESHFKAIGERYGPIDMAFIKVGDYGMDLGWRDIHMFTEYSIEAGRDVRASLFFPIHWGTFNLSFHDWYEPINLTVEFARKKNVALVTPKLGQSIRFGDKIDNESWWKDLEALSKSQSDQ